jgi:hypothetical protein
MYFYLGLADAELDINTVKEEVGWTKSKGVKGDKLMEEYIEEYNHVFPTDLIDKSGKAPKVNCDQMFDETGGVNNCNFDTAKHFLKHIYEDENDL